MHNQWEQLQKTRDWFKDNIVKAKQSDIKESKEICCGVPMMEYTGSEFVDWTHKCSVCKAMYGCA